MMITCGKKCNRVEKIGKRMSNFAHDCTVYEKYSKMIKFIGDYRAKVDDKGRLVFPSAFKVVMGDEPLSFVVKKDPFEPCLSIYTVAEWDRRSEELRSKLNPYNPEHNKLLRVIMGNRALIEPDPKLGRVAIPKALLDMIQVKKDVVFKGLDYKIELWSAETADAAAAQMPDEAEMAMRILGGN